MRWHTFQSNVDQCSSTNDKPTPDEKFEQKLNLRIDVRIEQVYLIKWTLYVYIFIDACVREIHVTAAQDLRTCNIQTSCFPQWDWDDIHLLFTYGNICAVGQYRSELNQFILSVHKFQFVPKWAAVVCEIKNRIIASANRTAVNSCGVCFYLISIFSSEKCGSRTFCWNLQDTDNVITTLSSYLCHVLSARLKGQKSAQTLKKNWSLFSLLLVISVFMSLTVWLLLFWTCSVYLT